MRAIECTMYRIGLSSKEKLLSSKQLFELFAHFATDDSNSSVVKSYSLSMELSRH